jgi:serine/threonine protein kinase/Tol biopolymer transport system component
LALAPGTRLGVYEVTAQIGAGGMGEVYKATDTNLKRAVALKVLPASVAADTERLARFQREAEVLAALNHPNIAAIYGLERSGAMTALVMELVEGDDLSQRIARGAIPLDEALLIAKQIAEALEGAHEQGIIHRDLKPANIKVRADGTVKVLDFGLAKAMEPAAGSSPSLSMSPTLSIHATQEGIILGTAAYMSPEQAAGKPVDKRSDVWSFGVVVLEMLTGHPVFTGETVSHVLASVLTSDPDWKRLPDTVPSRVVTVLRRCLQKDRKQRARDIGDVSLALEGAFETAAPQTTSSAASSAKGRRLTWMAAALAVAAVAIVALAIPAVRYLRETLPPETRVEIVTPATDQPTSFALSPDGRQIAFVESGNGESRLWLRSLATTTAQALNGTEGARFPFWSPDGRSVAYFTENALRRLDLGGGAPETLASVVNGSGGTWGADSVIVFASSVNATPLMRVSATGGAVAALTALGPQEVGHARPYFLPDGRRFVFYVRGAPATAGIYLGALDGSTTTRLTAADGGGTYLSADQTSSAEGASSGWLLWVRAGTLVAQRLDVAKGALTGEPVTLADGVAVDGRSGIAVSVAATGLVAYRTGGGNQRQLTWMDRSGRVRGTIGDPDGSLSNPRVSPDGRVAVQRTVLGNEDIWLLDGARTSRFTFDPAAEMRPVWSPDGTRIAFTSRRAGAGDLYQKLTSGAGAEDRIATSDQLKQAYSWSADGRFLLYNSTDPQTNTDLWVVPMAGDHTPSVFLKTPFREVMGVFSPDGRRVAYGSNESGRQEIYVRPFVPPSRDASADRSAGAAGGQWQVSTTGGAFPVWRPDGKELYYLNPAGAMMSAPITITGGMVEPGTPVVLFPTHIVGGGVEAQQGRQYDVAPDGRFLINTVPRNATTAPITLLMNWNPAQKK